MEPKATGLSLADIVHGETEKAPSGTFPPDPLPPPLSDSSSEPEEQPELEVQELEQPVEESPVITETPEVGIEEGQEEEEEILESATQQDMEEEQEEEEPVEPQEEVEEEEDREEEESFVPEPQIRMPSPKVSPSFVLCITFCLTQLRLQFLQRYSERIHLLHYLHEFPLLQKLIILYLSPNFHINQHQWIFQGSLQPPKWF